VSFTPPNRRLAQYLNNLKASVSCKKSWKISDETHDGSGVINAPNKEIKGAEPNCSRDAVLQVEEQLGYAGVSYRRRKVNFRAAYDSLKPEHRAVVREELEALR
jgi:hypothetical protein